MIEQVRGLATELTTKRAFLPMPAGHCPPEPSQGEGGHPGAGGPPPEPDPSQLGGDSSQGKEDLYNSYQTMQQMFSMIYRRPTRHDIRHGAAHGFCGVFCGCDQTDGEHHEPKKNAKVHDNSG